MKTCDFSHVFFYLLIFIPKFNQTLFAVYDNEQPT